MSMRTEELRTRLGDDLPHLIAGCAAGQEAASRRLLEEVRQLATEVGMRAYRLGREEAEDLAQEVQVRVASRLSQLRRPESFPLWVRRMIHHAALDLLRQRRDLVSLDAMVDPDAEIAPPTAASDPYDELLLRADLDRALARLPELYREPIRLHLLHGLPQDEVGRRLGRPRSTVATQVERGLGRLRRSLAVPAAASC
jgi:RNA polymerase sigma-70 factor (ECF subfamily)